MKVEYSLHKAESFFILLLKINNMDRFLKIHLVKLLNRLSHKELKSCVAVTYHRASKKEWHTKRMDPLV